MTMYLPAAVNVDDIKTESIPNSMVRSKQKKNIAREIRTVVSTYKYSWSNQSVIFKLEESQKNTQTNKEHTMYICHQFVFCTQKNYHTMRFEPI